MKKLKRVLKYLQYTKDLGLTINKTGNMAVKLYIDASFAVHKDAKSQSGAAVMIGSTLIEAKSTKQKTASKSSSESELNALSDLAGLGIWTCEVLHQLGEDHDCVV